MGWTSPPLFSLHSKNLCSSTLVMCFMDRTKDFHDISFLSWNIRGASNDKAKRHLKDFIRKYKPTFIFIMETYIQFDKTKLFWQQVGYSPIHIVEAQGHSGGLWAMIQNGHTLDILVWDITPFTSLLILNCEVKS